MTRLMTSAAALAMAAGAAQAGGIERSNLDFGMLFATGDQVQMSLSHVSPTISGTYSADLTAAGGGEDDTGNMAGSYTNYTLAYKNDFSDKLTFGL